jgi:indole-3-glycerol phosphate synthase
LSNSYDFWIAINSRNLETMEIDKNIHFKIFEKYKEKLKKKYLFAFSWINNLEEINNYKWKFNWVLIWSYFMKNIH